MHYRIRPLQKSDLSQASLLDRKWFGDYGISVVELDQYIEAHPQESLAIVDDNILFGFATFEILDRNVPTNYHGMIVPSEKILFIQQFTTTTNYQISDSKMDGVLIVALEKKAKELSCTEVWEALAVDHPYKKENKPDFDAFGFYESKGYTIHQTQQLMWQPDTNISIPCFLFRKNL